MPAVIVPSSARPPRGLSLPIAALVALVAGLVIGWLDLSSTEVQGIVALLLVAGGALGLASRRAPWLVAILLGLGVPLVHLALWVLHEPQPYPIPHPWSVLLAMVPAAAGALGGALVRRMF